MWLPVAAAEALLCPVQLVHAGQLLLMDAGCERHGYVSDVTRTWPVSGQFSEPQLAVYDLVLEVYRRGLHSASLPLHAGLAALTAP